MMIYHRNTVYICCYFDFNSRTIDGTKEPEQRDRNKGTRTMERNKKRNKQNETEQKNSQI